MRVRISLIIVVECGPEKFHQFVKVHVLEGEDGGAQAQGDGECLEGLEARQLPARTQLERVPAAFD